MPTSDAIVAGLTDAANQWRLVAVAWHVALATMLIALACGWRPSTREASWFTGRKVMMTRSALLIGAIALVAGVLATYRASQGLAILLVGASVAAFGIGLVLLHLWTTRGLR